jgi:hypothetical protein
MPLKSKKARRITMQSSTAVGYRPPNTGFQAPQQGRQLPPPPGARAATPPVTVAAPAPKAQPSAAQVQEAIRKIVPVLAKGTNDAIDKMFTKEDQAIQQIENVSRTKLKTSIVGFPCADGSIKTLRVRSVELYRTHIGPNLVKNIEGLSEGKRRVFEQILDCCEETLPGQYQVSLRCIEAEVRDAETPPHLKNITYLARCDQTPLKESRILRQYAYDVVTDPMYARYVDLVVKSLGLK